MYTDEDLDLAVKKGVFDSSSVTAFRGLVAKSKHSSLADEEGFKLIGGFNDIFIVIACALFLYSCVSIFRIVSPAVGFTVLVAMSWALAEFFVRKRKMALPAILLLLSFVYGVFSLSASLLLVDSPYSLMAATALTACAAYLHWRRFNVPVTVAAGVMALVGLVAAIVFALSPTPKKEFIDSAALLMALFVCGWLCFFSAMIWDSSDIARTTRRSDVGFWLHLLSAPLIIHPLFSSVASLADDSSLISLVVVIVLYGLLTSISLAVDRRAFMVSSLFYVLAALSNLFGQYGGISYSSALTGVCMGGSLLLLSAYWRPARSRLLTVVPAAARRHLPTA